MSTAVPAYRNLLRAVRVAFRDDSRTISAARSTIRQGFREKAALKPTDQEFQLAVQHAEVIAMLLRKNVVQGRLEGDRYKLRIHEETERGDNDTIKFAGETLRQGGVKSCSS